MNCKPGDLAYIVGLPNTHCGRNNGRVVEVLRLYDNTAWWVRAIGPMYGIESGAERPVKPGEAGICADEHLRPISGIPLSNDTTTEETKPQEVPA